MKKKILTLSLVGMMFFCGGEGTLSYNQSIQEIIKNDDSNYLSQNFYNSLREGLVYLKKIQSSSRKYGSISSYIEIIMDMKLTPEESCLFNEEIPDMIDNYSNYIVSYERGDSRGCFLAIQNLMNRSINFNNLINLYGRLVGTKAIDYSIDVDSITINDITIKSLYPTDLSSPNIFTMANNISLISSMDISYSYSNYVYWSYYYRDFGKLFDEHIFLVDKSFENDTFYISYFSDLVNIRNSICKDTLDQVDGINYRFADDYFIVYSEKGTRVFGLYTDTGKALNKVVMIDNYLKHNNQFCDELYDVLYDNCNKISEEDIYVY